MWSINGLAAIWCVRIPLPRQDIFKRIVTLLLIPQLLWVTVLLSGCAATGGLAGGGFTRPDIFKKIDQTKISQIKEGETTRAEVEQLLGQPMWGMMNPLTQEITLSYVGDVHTGEPVGEQVIGFMFPIPSIILPHHFTTKSQYVSITINVDGKVTKISSQLRQSTGDYAILGSDIQGNKIDFSKVAQIHEGETTTAELEDLLGVPQLITEESHEVTWTYEWNCRNGAHNQHENVTVTVDPQGKVKMVSKDSYQSHNRFYGNSSVPLDRNNLLKIQVGKTTREEVDRLLGQAQWEFVMEREAVTQTCLQYHRSTKKEGFSCFEQVNIVLDATGMVESIK